MPKLLKECIDKITKVSYLRMLTLNLLGRLLSRIINLSNSKTKVYLKLLQCILNLDKLNLLIYKKYGNIQIDLKDWSYTVKLEDNK